MHPGIYLIIAAEMERKRQREYGRMPNVLEYDQEPRVNSGEGLIGRLVRWLRREPRAQCPDAACNCT